VADFGLARQLYNGYDYKKEGRVRVKLIDSLNFNLKFENDYFTYCLLFN
jgi:hypothetical protein